MSLRSVRVEAAAVVRARLGSFQVSDVVPERWNTPAAAVMWPELTWSADVTADGSVSFDLPIRFVVGLSDSVSAQYAIDSIITDIAAAFETHPGQSWRSARPLRNTVPAVTDAGAIFFDLIIQIRAKLTA